MDFRGKTAVVTGGASGIGRATAVAFAREGANIVLADINEARLAEAVEEISSFGRKALAVRTDVSKLGDVQNLFERSVAEMGQVDILMNNAGVHMMGPVEKLSIADWEWLVGINFWGVVYGIHVFLPHMLERGSGHIINTASIAGLAGWKDPSLPYTASKFAVVGISEGLAVHLRDKGIGVTVACPDLVLTGIAERARFIPSDDGADEARRSLYEAFNSRDWVRLTMLRERLQLWEILSPDTVAEMIVDAVKNNKFFVATHPGTREMMLLRAQDPDGMVSMVADMKAAQDDALKALTEEMRRQN